MTLIWTVGLPPAVTARGRSRRRCQSSRCLLVNRAVPRIFVHAYQLQAKVANSVKDAVEVGLIADLAGEDAVFIARFEGKPFEGVGRR